jgi:hypothetical protein
LRLADPAVVVLRPVAGPPWVEFIAATATRSSGTANRVHGWATSKHQLFQALVELGEQLGVVLQLGEERLLRLDVPGLAACKVCLRNSVDYLEAALRRAKEFEDALDGITVPKVFSIMLSDLTSARTSLQRLDLPDVIPEALSTNT